MAGALGLLTGMGFGAATNYAKEKNQQKHQHDSMLFDFYSQESHLVADSPDAQKFITRYAGPEASTAFIGMAQHAKAASEQFGQITGGGGGAPTAGPQPRNDGYDAARAAKSIQCNSSGRWATIASNRSERHRR